MWPALAHNAWQMRPARAESFRLGDQDSELGLLMTYALAGDSITICRVDYADVHDAAALVMLLDGYAQDVAGGSELLTAEVKRGLPRR